MSLFNRPSEKKRRQTLRKNMPNAEIVLWKKIKGKQVNGHRFRRQYSVGKYIVDFFCPELMLAVEIDGDSHFRDDENQRRDKIRQEFIEKQGVSFLRFTNDDVYHKCEGVLMAIEEFGKGKTTPPAPPLSKGRIEAGFLGVAPCPLAKGRK
ncbi:MAG: DUF559 domain-containing protein [Nitrospinae bacterium]|nr:DUF559 domain-containing protein [Nitrospinota bacterium]